MKKRLKKKKQKLKSWIKKSISFKNIKRQKQPRKKRRLKWQMMLIKKRFKKMKLRN